MTSRYWCYTLNNPGPEDVEKAKALDSRFTGFGREVGASGTPHLQGVLITVNAVRLAGLKKLLPTAHWEKMKGTPAQAWAYCIKEDKAPFSVGTLPGKVGDNLSERYDAAIANAKAGLLDAIPGDMMCKYHGYFEKLKTKHAVVEDLDDVCGIWIVGPAGCGKSRLVRSEYPGFFPKLPNRWFDGYDDEKHDSICIDDVDTSHAWLSYHFNIWADRYSFAAEVKGGMMMLRPKHCIVTSRYDIEEIWTEASTLESLKRRFKVIKMGTKKLHPIFQALSYKMTEPGVYVYTSGDLRGEAALDDS